MLLDSRNAALLVNSVSDGIDGSAHDFIALFVAMLQADRRDEL